MSRNRLKVMMLCWAFLVIAIIWIDRWSATLVFGAAMCLLGVVVLTITAGVPGPDRKESRGVGLLFMIVGAFLVLLQMIDRFVIENR
jgi:hypothetical protein